MKGISTFIATVLLVITTVTIGLGVYWWYKSTISPVLEKTGESAQSQALCSLASIRMLRENSYCDSYGNISFYIENGKVKLSDLFVDVYAEQYIGSFKIHDKYGNEIKEIDPNKILRVFVKVNESKKSYTIKIRNNCNVESSLTIKCNWLEGWFYRIPISINNTASTNLQNVEINLDSLTLISDAKLRRDCSDIRFTDSDGISLLNYNISNCNSENTKIWINITIPANSNKTIYLYYGNPSANLPVYYNITSVPQISISIVFPKAWLSDFQYRISILINNTLNPNNLTDYQILVTLNTQSLISAGKMRSDCGDIRFTDSDGTTLLNYWIESGCDSNNTRIWIKVNISASSTKTIYLYYGNLSASSLSNGDATFDFFDDFLGTSLNISKWTAGCWTGSGGYSVTVSNGYVRIYSGSSTAAGIVSKTGFSFPFIVEGSYRWVSGAENWHAIVQTSSGSDSDWVRHGYSYTAYYYQKRTSGTISTYQSLSRFPPTFWTRIKIIWTSSSSFYYENYNQVNTVTTQDRWSSGTNYIQLFTWNGGTSDYDWIAVRKYTYPEPTTSLGAEQSLSNITEQNYYSY